MADERDFNSVSGLKFDDTTLTATAAGKRFALDEQSGDAIVEFDATPAPVAARRDLNSSVGGEIHGTLFDTGSFKIVVNEASSESNIRLKGGFRSNLLKFKYSAGLTD